MQSAHQIASNAPGTGASATFKVWSAMRNGEIVWTEETLAQLERAPAFIRVRTFGRNLRTGEIKNPAAYARLKEQFFAELLEQPARAEGDR